MTITYKIQHRKDAKISFILLASIIVVSFALIMLTTNLLNVSPVKAQTSGQQQLSSTSNNSHHADQLNFYSKLNSTQKGQQPANTSGTKTNSTTGNLKNITLM